MSNAFRLGVFVFAALCVFAGGVFLIGSKQFLFRSTYRLNAQFPNVVGLTDGAEVRVDLPHRPDQKVTVEMDLQNATRNVIKKDSVAYIQAEGLVGDKYVEVSFGSNQAAAVNSGDTIGSEAPLEISALVKKADQILNDMQGAVQNVDVTTENLKSVTSKINQGKGSVGALLNDKELYRHVNAGATAFQEDMEALKHNFLIRGFFKNRGYEDSSSLTKHEIARLPDGPYSKKFAYDAKSMFTKPDSAKLKNQKQLNETGHFLEENRFGLAVVAAYSGMKGDSDEERQLTQARAAVVRDYLVQNFKLDDTKVKTIGLGKSEEAEDDGKIEIVISPAASNGTSGRGRPSTK